MQVDPIKPKLKPPGIERLKLKYDEPPSNFAFKFNLRHCILASGSGRWLHEGAVTNFFVVRLQTDGRGLHSSTCQLNVSAFCGIGGAFRGCLGGV